MKELLLKNAPNATLAANGLIFNGDDGVKFHALSMYTNRDLEGLAENETFLLDFCSKAEIFRLRELKNSHDYLLRLRAKAISSSPRAIRVMLSRKKTYETAKRTWALSHYYHSKDHYHKAYISHLLKENRKKLKEIPAGLAFIPEANALCVRSLAGDVVVVSESLEYFYYFMSIAFYGERLNINVKDRINALLIAVRIMNQAEALDFEIDPRGPLPLETERQLKLLVQAQMEFTYGHEYSHYLCGHLTAPETTLYAINNFTHSAEAPEFAVYNHELEYEADITSLKLVQHNKNTHTRLSMGAFSVLLYLNFLERVRHDTSLKPLSISLTHPTPISRIWKLLDNLGTKSPVTKTTLVRYLSGTENMIKALKHLLSHNREDALTFYGSIYLPSYTQKLKKDRIDY